MVSETPEGRLQIVVRHAPLPGITPEMMRWWYARGPGREGRETLSVGGRERSLHTARVDTDAGVARVVRWFGHEVARWVDTYHAHADGLECHSVLLVGANEGRLRWLINRVLRPLLFGKKAAERWCSATLERFAALRETLPEQWRTRDRTPVPVTVLGVAPRRQGQRRAG